MSINDNWLIDNHVVMKFGSVPRSGASSPWGAVRMVRRSHGDSGRWEDRHWPHPSAHPFVHQTIPRHHKFLLFSKQDKGAFPLRRWGNSTDKFVLVHIRRDLFRVEKMKKSFATHRIVAHQTPSRIRGLVNVTLLNHESSSAGLRDSTGGCCLF